MFAVFASRAEPANPLAALECGALPEPAVPDGWVAVRMRAASLNMHDVGTLQGVRLRGAQYPAILGCDGAGVLADGTEVVVHASVSDPDWSGPETLDPGRTVLSERYPGTFADVVAVPAANAVPKPAGLPFAEAACLPTAWLTAYRMLFVRSGLRPGGTMLLDGRLGSIAVALLRLGTAAGMRVWVHATGADAARAERLGAHRVIAPDAAPEPVADAAFDAGVDPASWSHRAPWVRPGGTIVCAGFRAGTSETGYSPAALETIILRELRLAGTAMGTRADLAALLAFVDRTGVRPPIAERMPITRAADGFRAMLGGRAAGKIVFTW